jgi:hypothetical protein
MSTEQQQDYAVALREDMERHEEVLAIAYYRRGRAA